jgi:hypothetical protein
LRFEKNKNPNAMKKVFFSILLVLIVISAKTQEKSNEVNFKIYYNFNSSIFNHTYSYSDYEYSKLFPNIKNYKIGDLSLALQLKSPKKFFSEFELMPVSFQKTKFTETATPSGPGYGPMIEGNGLVRFNSYFRYQLNYTIVDKKHFDFYCGLSTLIFTDVTKFEYYTSTNFPKKFTEIGGIFGITPGFEIPLTHMLKFSLDVPIGILGLRNGRYKIDDPTVNEIERNQNDFVVELGNQGFQIRAGLGIVF